MILLQLSTENGRKIMSRNGNLRTKKSSRFFNSLGPEKEQQEEEEEEGEEKEKEEEKDLKNDQPLYCNCSYIKFVHVVVCMAKLIQKVQRIFCNQKYTKQVVKLE